jgi:hypothetical protein
LVTECIASMGQEGASTKNGVLATNSSIQFEDLNHRVRDTVNS